MTDAIAPPTNGPTMNIHRLLHTAEGPPASLTNKAGPNERAGLTDVPV